MQKFAYADQVVETIVSAISSGKRIGLYGDYDVDGLMSMLQFKDTFEKLNYDNVRCFAYENRTRGIDPNFVNFCLINKIELAIVCDTGSSDIPILEKLNQFGIKCIVLDHHRTTNRYSSFPTGVTIISSYLDEIEFDIHNTMCGAGMVFVICSMLLGEKKLEYEIGYFACYALIGMYADSVRMDTEFGRFLYETCEGRNSTPAIVDYFMGDKFILSRRFVEYWLSPKINAAFRREQFYLINSLFLGKNPDIFALIKEFENLHINTMEIVKRIVANVECEDLGNIVVANLSPFLLDKTIPTNFVINHKGRVASELGGIYGKVCIAVCSTGSDIEGSLRDLKNRDFLQYFESIYAAGGHPPAFGFVLKSTEWEDFMETVRQVNDLNISGNPVDHEIYDCGLFIDYDIIDRIAYNNEFSSTENPTTYVKLKLSRIRESTTYGYSYYVGSYNGRNYYLSSNERLLFPENVIVYPYRSRTTKLKLVRRCDVV